MKMLYHLLSSANYLSMIRRFKSNILLQLPYLYRVPQGYHDTMVRLFQSKVDQWYFVI